MCLHKLHKSTIVCIGMHTTTRVLFYVIVRMCMCDVLCCVFISCVCIRLRNTTDLHKYIQVQYMLGAK